MVRKLSLSRLASVPRIGAAAVAIAAAAVFCSLELSENPSGQFPTPPELRAKNHTLSLTLHAGITKDGKNSFYFDGQPNAPTLRLSPGDQLKINYINDLPAHPQESCAITPCMDMTNLHFHGLTVSPDAPQDDVLDMMAMPGQSLRYALQIPQDHPPGLYWYHTHPHGESHRQALDGMSGALVIEGIASYFPPLVGLPERVLVDVLGMMAMPGQSLRYTVQIPVDHPPGLYWFHTHPHGESHRQVLDGMSGAIVIEGIESYFPPLVGLPERVLVVRGRSVVNDPKSADLKRRVELSSDICGAESEPPEEVFTVNGAVRPQIEIASGERQFWRVVNASADRYVDLQLEEQTFEIVAMDGMPIALHDPKHRTRSTEHVLLPPAGRVA